MAIFSHEFCCLQKLLRIAQARQGGGRWPGGGAIGRASAQQTNPAKFHCLRLGQQRALPLPSMVTLGSGTVSVPAGWSGRIALPCGAVIQLPSLASGEATTALLQLPPCKEDKAVRGRELTATLWPLLAKDRRWSGTVHQILNQLRTDGLLLGSGTATLKVAFAKASAAQAEAEAMSAEATDKTSTVAATAADQSTGPYPGIPPPGLEAVIQRLSNPDPSCKLNKADGGAAEIEQAKRLLLTAIHLIYTGEAQADVEVDMVAAPVAEEQPCQLSKVVAGTTSLTQATSLALRYSSELRDGESLSLTISNVKSKAKSGGTTTATTAAEATALATFTFSFSEEGERSAREVDSFRQWDLIDAARELRVELVQSQLQQAKANQSKIAKSKPKAKAKIAKSKPKAKALDGDLDDYFK